MDHKLIVHKHCQSHQLLTSHVNANAHCNVTSAKQNKNGGLYHLFFFLFLFLPFLLWIRQIRSYIALFIKWRSGFYLVLLIMIIPPQLLAEWFFFLDLQSVGTARQSWSFSCQKTKNRFGTDSEPALVANGQITPFLHWFSKYEDK